MVTALPTESQRYRANGLLINNNKNSAVPGQSRHVFGARCGGARFRPRGVGIAASRGRARRCARRRRRRRCRGRRASCNARRVAACARSSSRRVNVYGMVDKTSVVYINNVWRN